MILQSVDKPFYSEECRNWQVIFEEDDEIFIRMFNTFEEADLFYGVTSQEVEYNRVMNIKYNPENNF
jgi:hypothetical protein